MEKAECQRIDAFELWCWRRLLSIPWTAGRSNQSILKEIISTYSAVRSEPVSQLISTCQLLDQHLSAASTILSHQGSLDTTQQLNNNYRRLNPRPCGGRAVFTTGPPGIPLTGYLLQSQGQKRLPDDDAFPISRGKRDPVLLPGDFQGQRSLAG